MKAWIVFLSLLSMTRCKDIDLWNREDVESRWKAQIEEQNRIHRKRIEARSHAIGDGPRRKKLEETPKDWPMTFEQFYFLMEDNLESLARRSVDQNELNRIGFKNRKELVQFAWEMIDKNLYPIEHAQHYYTYEIKHRLYVLIGLYGDLEDAARLFHRMRTVHFKYYEETSSDEYKQQSYLVHAIGFFLMRDHFMPQQNRELMRDIEDYLFNCTVLDSKSCWLWSDVGKGNDQMRYEALKALALSCSKKAKRRILQYLDVSRDWMQRFVGNKSFILLNHILDLEEEIKAKLDPVLPREN